MENEVNIVENLDQIRRNSAFFKLPTDGLTARASEVIETLTELRDALQERSNALIDVEITETAIYFYEVKGVVAWKN